MEFHWGYITLTCRSYFNFTPFITGFLGPPRNERSIPHLPWSSRNGSKKRCSLESTGGDWKQWDWGSLKAPSFLWLGNGGFGERCKTRIPKTNGSLLRFAPVPVAGASIPKKKTTESFFQLFKIPSMDFRCELAVSFREGIEKTYPIAFMYGIFTKGDFTGSSSTQMCDRW